MAQESQTSANSSVSRPVASSPPDELLSLPVSIDRIKGALEQAPTVPLIRLDDKPHFKIEVRERQKIRIEDLIATMDFVKSEKGADVLEAIMNRVPEADRKAIETCSPTAEMPLMRPRLGPP